MSLLSYLFSISQAKVSIDVRCALANSFVLPHLSSPPGTAFFHFVLAGECRLQVEKRPLLHMKTGDFVLLTHGDAHSVIDAHDLLPSPPEQNLRIDLAGSLPLKSNIGNTATPEAHLLCGRFIYGAESGTRNILLQSLPQVLHVNLQDYDMASLRALPHLLSQEAVDAQPGARTIIDALGLALLTLALRAYGGSNASPAHWLALATDARLGASIQAILNAPGLHWTIAGLGAMVGMSRATYARHFQQRSGMTVGVFLTMIRMTHACNLLTRSRRGIADIAEASGYQSEAAFGKMFRQIMGKTPGRWRREQRDELD